VNNREIVKLIKSLKDEPEFGGGFDFDKSWEKFADQYGFEKNYKDFKITWKDYLEYFTHISSKAIVRPVGAAIASLALVLGGWVTTVNASFGSVPGDLLYPVKLVTERVQISLAATNEQRARLHTEFASRRLNEVIEIAASDRIDKDELVKETVESFKISISSATTAVENIATTSPEAAANVAMVVDQKVEAMSSVISANENSTSLEAHTEQLAEAQNSTQESDQKLTETIVTSNETIKQDRTNGYLQDSFKKDMIEIDTRKANLLVRVANIEAAIAGGAVSDSYVKNTEVITNTLETFEDELVEARNYFAAGGWRRVLEIVTGLKNKLSVAEMLVTEMEIEISSGG
jgi:hypothetical protein